MKPLFDYPIPQYYQLYKEYGKPYRVSEQLKAEIHKIFSHPHHPHHEFFYKNHNDDDLNNMGKVAYVYTLEFLNNPQQYGHSIENIHMQMLVSMWKVFIGVTKYFKWIPPEEYMKVKSKLLKINAEPFLTECMNEVNQNRVIMSGDDMVKKREGKGLRESNRASLKEDGKYFEYLSGLE